MSQSLAKRSSPLFSTSSPNKADNSCAQPGLVCSSVDGLAEASIRLLYLDDCDIDHRLLSAYLRMDGARTYTVTACTTVEEALLAIQGETYDALIIDNRVPPFSDYHEPYRHLKQNAGYQGPTLIISADISGHEFNADKRQDHELVLDKADLLPAVKSGLLAQVVQGNAPTHPHSATIAIRG